MLVDTICDRTAPPRGAGHQRTTDGSQWQRQRPPQTHLLLVGAPPHGQHRCRVPVADGYNAGGLEVEHLDLVVPAGHDQKVTRGRQRHRVDSRVLCVENGLSPVARAATVSAAGLRARGKGGRPTHHDRLIVVPVPAQNAPVRARGEKLLLTVVALG